MALLSLLYGLICKECKANSGSFRDHRAHRHEERRQRQVLKKRQISSPQGTVQYRRMSREHQCTSLVVCSAKPGSEPRTTSSVDLEAAADTSSCSLVIPPSAMDVTFTTTVSTTTVSTRTVLACQYSASLSLPSLAPSPKAAVHRILAADGIHLLAEDCSSVSSTAPQLTLPWENRPRSVFMPEMSTAIPVDVRPLMDQPVKQCGPLLLTDTSSGSSGKSLSSSSSSSSPSPSPSFSPSFSSLSTPLASSTGSSFNSPISGGALSPSFSDRMVARQSLLENVSGISNVNVVKLDRGNSGHRQRHSGSSISSTTTTTTTASSGPRYIPSSMSLLRPHSVALLSSTQQALPFLRGCKTGDLSTSSSSSSSSTSCSSSLCSSPSPPFPLSSSSSTSQLASSFANRPGRRYQPSAALARILSEGYTKPSYTSPSSSLRFRIPYNSTRGHTMLKALRRLLVIPAEWSAAQTLLFVLQHPNLRRLSLPDDQPVSLSSSSSSSSSSSYRDLLSVPRCNTLDWTGVLRSMLPALQMLTRARKPVSAATSLSSHPFSAASSTTSIIILPAKTCTQFSASDRQLVSSWLESGEPLFTRQTAMASLLLRRGPRARARRQFLGPWQALRKAQLEALTESLMAQLYDNYDDKDDNKMAILTRDDDERYAIALNPRCRYHQLWTGAGASPLSQSIVSVNV